MASRRSHQEVVRYTPLRKTPKQWQLPATRRKPPLHALRRAERSLNFTQFKAKEQTRKIMGTHLHEFGQFSQTYR